jgi:A/G-specific adenine glycosylase
LPLKSARPAFKPATRALLAWYDIHGRALPWRVKNGKADCYLVWLSEIMLQQTTVAAVIPYFEKFRANWPDVAALAAARDEEILSAWAGLGYYSRARNLIKAARLMAADGAPQDEAGWRALPGVGPYTAAAVAAIALGQRAVVVDGNVERVMARLHALETPLPQGKPAIYAAMDALTPQTRAGDFAQAMMDLGATLCTPKKPACALCPLRAFCAASHQGAPETYPKKAPKAARPERVGAVYIARRADGALLMRTRPEKGLLGGMSEFPGTDWAAQYADAPPLKARWRACGRVRHIFTHFALELDVFCADVAASTPAVGDCRWVSRNALAREALPSLMKKALELAAPALATKAARGKAKLK